MYRKLKTSPQNDIPIHPSRHSDVPPCEIAQLAWAPLVRERRVSLHRESATTFGTPQRVFSRMDSDRCRCRQETNFK